MARKKQEVQLQQEIETQEEWEEMMGKEGLWVIDLYQEWCGPCAAMISNFRRLKNELGDDLLHFATAKVDTIDALDKYKGRCEPTFLFFACGVLVAVIHGSQSPLVMRTVTEQLAQEHKVIDGNSERKEIKDALIGEMEDTEKGELDEDENEKDDDNIYRYRGEHINYGESLEYAEDSEQSYTVAIIKPDAVKNGKVEEIMEQMKEKGIEIIAEEERQMTEDEAREFYVHLKDEEYFEELVQYMSSGPSHMLVLTKGTSEGSVLNEWRDMIGPTSVDEAKEQAPDSLRAKYGSGKVMNALHGSSSPETAAREMAFFFPSLSAPKQQKSKSSHVQRTLALIRPDAFRTHRESIMENIKQAGFKVALQKQMTLSKEQAAEFYKEHEGQDYFDDLVTRMSSGPLMALGLAREDAIQGWREMLGPKEVQKAKEEAPESLRAQFAVDDVEINSLHGSDSPETAQKELEYFFPMEQTIACIKPDAIGTKDAIIDKIHEAGFRIAAQKETIITKDIAEEFYAEHKDKDYYADLVNHMTSGPTMFMVLSREDAVSGWRETIGPTDPTQAKEQTPESLRAMFGKDILQNAVHGSSTSDHAVKTIAQVFGNLEFNADDVKPASDEEQQAERRSPVQDVGETGDADSTEKETEKESNNEETKEDEEKPRDTETSTKSLDEESKPDEQSEKPRESESPTASLTEESKPDEQSEKPRESPTASLTEESKPDEQNEKPRDTESPTKSLTEADQSETPEENKTDQSEDSKPDDSGQVETSDQSKPIEDESSAKETEEAEGEKPDITNNNNEINAEQSESKDGDSPEKKEETVTESTDKTGESEDGAIKIESQTDDPEKPKEPETKNESDA